MAYNNTKTVTIDRTKVSNTDQSNFPVLISGTYAYLATQANSGNILNTVSLNGQTVPADLIFASDSLGTILLSWEVASYNAATGQIEVWIKIPVLSHTADTVIYMLYGNAAITTYQSTATTVWSDYTAVYHVANGVTLSGNDSTVSAFNATISGPKAVTGKIDGGSGFGSTFGSGANDALITPSLLWPQQLTLSCWIWINNAGPTNQGRLIDQNNTLNDIRFNATTTTLLFMVNFSGTAGTWSFSAPSFSNWHYLKVVYDAGNTTNIPQIYIDGIAQSVTVSSPPVGSFAAQGTPIYIGNRQLGGRNWDGLIDDIRLSSGVLHTADWVTTEYNNQAFPSTFYAIADMVASIAQTGSGADSWEKYLVWLQKRKKSEFKKRAQRAGVKEVVAAQIVAVVAQEIQKHEDTLRQPFFDYSDDKEARLAAQDSIVAIYDEVWKQMAVQKREITDLKINIKKKQEGDEEDDVFLMVM